jgi:hypothetical protein
VRKKGQGKIENPTRKIEGNEGETQRNNEILSESNQ